MTPAEASTTVSLDDLVTALDQGLRSKAGRWESLKTIGSAGVFFVALIGGGAVTFQELQDKPTTEQVEHRIEESVAPVRALAVGVAEDLGEVKTDLERVKDVQDYSLQNAAWQGEVLDHIAQRKKGKPTAKPETLKDTERDLLRGTK